MNLTFFWMPTYHPSLTSSIIPANRPLLSPQTLLPPILPFLQTQHWPSPLQGGLPNLSRVTLFSGNFVLIYIIILLCLSEYSMMCPENRDHGSSPCNPSAWHTVSSKHPPLLHIAATGHHSPQSQRYSVLGWIRAL